MLDVVDGPQRAGEEGARPKFRTGVGPTGARSCGVMPSRLPSARNAAALCPCSPTARPYACTDDGANLGRGLRWGHGRAKPG